MPEAVKKGIQMPALAFVQNATPVPEHFPTEESLVAPDEAHSSDEDIKEEVANKVVQIEEVNKFCRQVWSPWLSTRY